MPVWWDPRLTVLAAAAAVLVLLLAWIVVARRRRRPAPYGANPNPAYITDEMWWLWGQLATLAPGSQLGGIYADKPGYHNSREQLPPYDYSVVDPPDRGGPGDKAAAIDWTFPEAQSGDYSRIAVFTSRLLASAQDQSDPRLNGWREFYGQADTDAYVEGWDTRYGYAVTSDSSHLWHIHLSENRDQTTSKANKEALLSVLRGEPLAAWIGGEEGSGVLITCPGEPDRLDLFTIAPDGGVWHRWVTGTMDALWTGKNVKVEGLGGRLVAGTLSACWIPDGTGINIVGLGAADEPGCPDGAGQFWGQVIYRSGAKSGWGSLTGVYGAWPAPPG